MPAQTIPPIAAKRPAPLSQADREQIIRQWMEAEQQVRRYTDFATCPVNELNSFALRDAAISRWTHRREAVAATLELDDRLTGRDFLTDAMATVIGDQDIPTAERIRSYLVATFFTGAEVDARMPFLTRKEAA
jgi:hypothetical protein